MEADGGSLEWAAIGISSLSFVIAIFSYVASKRQHVDERTSDLISQNWEYFTSLHELRAEFPYHSHLFEVGAQYDQAVYLVTRALSATPAESRDMMLLRLQLEERALVRRMFSMFEHAYYQAENAKRHKDKQRIAFLGDVLFYFTDRLLTNPRLAWYWSSTGGNQSVHYEKNTRDFYSSHVKIPKMDDYGPFEKVYGGAGG